MILGIDPSLSATGLCLYNGSAVIRETITSKFAGVLRLRAIADAIVNHHCDRELCVIEGVVSSFGKGDRSELMALHWFIRDRLYPSPTLVVAPAQLKKFVLGSGKGEKSLMLREVYRRWGVEAANDNEADAVGLAMIGAAYLDESRCVNQAQREVVAALKAGPKRKRKAA